MSISMSGYSGTGKSHLFQSLKGFDVDFDVASANQPYGFWLFQSLKGFDVDFDDRVRQMSIDLVRFNP